MFLSVLGAQTQEITTTHPYSLSSCSLKMGLFSELVLHTICGTKFGANLGLFWDSIWVQKHTKTGADSTPFPMPFLDHLLIQIWAHVCIMLKSFESRARHSLI